MTCTEKGGGGKGGWRREEGKGLRREKGKRKGGIGGKEGGARRGR